MAEPYSRGPWNDEKLWDPDQAGQAAYLVPPLANIADGPSGLTYYPGVSLLPERYNGHFFLADFRGAPAARAASAASPSSPKGPRSSWSTRTSSSGASLATDVDFGPDGALYFTDWVEGWDKPNKGRIYRVLDPARRDDPAVREVKRLLAGGMENAPNRRAGHAPGPCRHEGPSGGPVRAGRRVAASGKSIA